VQLGAIIFLMPPPLPPGDQKLVQIIDAALADTARRSGDWLVCKLGCTQCCVGIFAINQLDAVRLQHGLADLEANDPSRAARVKQRARDSVDRLKREFPGDPQTGVLDESDEAAVRFESFANDEACPALDPVTGACDLYASRPMTCRVFGPPVRSEEGLGVCELCYHGAKAELVEELRQSGRQGQTVVAFALIR
jgi:Fe-S-cluster containining protein